jgi:hypothetical protein
MIRQSVLEVLASRASVELGRVAMVRPALKKRCERAEGILAGHVASPRAGVIRARVRSGELVGYLVRGSGLPGGGEGLVALLVPGPPRASSPEGRGLTGVQTRARVLGAVAGGFGGTVPRSHGRGRRGRA